MYYYDRRDKFGNKRELHVDKALDVVDTKRYVPYESSSNAYDEALNEAAATIEADSSEGQLLVSCNILNVINMIYPIQYQLMSIQLLSAL